MKVFFIGKDLKINMNLFQLGSKDIGIDLGTANVLVTIKDKGIVLKEPSVVAIDLKTNSLLAIGKEAKEMLGKTPEQIKAIRPLKDGVIADFTATQLMLKEVLRRISKKYNVGRPRIVVGVPSGITEVEERAVEEALIQAGAREVFLIEEPMAAAIGSNIEIAEPSGNLIVDIGGGTTDVAIIALGGVVASTSIRHAGDKFNEAIVQYIRKRHALLIGDKTAEELKINLGCACMDEDEFGNEIIKTTNARGRDIISGLPKTLEITNKDMMIALQESMDIVVDAVKATIEKAPPEIAADIAENGMMLSGGGAKIYNLDKLIKKKTDMDVAIAENAFEAVALGTGKGLEDVEKLKVYTRKSKRRGTES